MALDLAVIGGTGLYRLAELRGEEQAAVHHRQVHRAVARLQVGVVGVDQRGDRADRLVDRGAVVEQVRRGERGGEVAGHQATPVSGPDSRPRAAS